ncbi:uncharacterized protein [Epargyreus clarus]|uniref:uncharacterized protein n=1 Tax=Epargyreus clarus TaxID=520877 RepID=UPI003C2EA852
MRKAVYFLLLLCSIFLNCNALNCRSEGGPKENELKKIYNICMKRQGNDKNSNSRGDADQDWRGTGRYNQWSPDNMARNRDSNGDYRMGERDDGNEGNRMENRDRTGSQNKMRSQDREDNRRDNWMGHNERHGDEEYTRNGRDERYNNNDNRFQRNNGVSSRNDFFQNDEYSGYNSNQYSTQPSRRYKRERRVEMNSGKRSQYNPNPQRFSGYEEKYSKEDKNSSENNSNEDDDSKSCAVHCLLDNLQMTDENGMPDRYLVTHVITKDVKDDDLKDFLQESIEECFQILNNENSEDKCEFSKSLLMCMSEKGRANCDDWKDDFQF